MGGKEERTRNTFPVCWGGGGGEQLLLSTPGFFGINENMFLNQ